MPAFIAYAFILEKTDKKQLPILTSKLIALLVAITLIFGVYYLIQRSDLFSSFLAFPVIYSLLLIISTILLKKSE